MSPVRRRGIVVGVVVVVVVVVATPQKKGEFRWLLITKEVLLYNQKFA